MRKFQFSLDDALSRRVRIFLLVAASVIPTVFVLKHYNPPPHFSRLIQFGRDERPASLPEVKALNPPMDSEAGYDGQFYAQVAIHPLLTDTAALKQAIDQPAYRSRRILMPVMAHILGFGRPGLVLEIYALLNLGFWFALLFGMAHFLKCRSARDYLCIFAAVFTTGSLVSLSRSLTDLPATTLLFYAAALGPAAATGVLALAVLLRETSALFLVKFLWPPPKTAKDWLTLAGRSALILLPLALWYAYVRHVFGGEGGPARLLTLPLAGWGRYLQIAWFNFAHMTWQLPARPLLSWSEALHHPGKEWTRWWGLALAYMENTTNQEWRTFEFLSALSLLAQVCFFAIWRSPQSPYWRMGAAFALLMICMPTSEEEIAFCRAVLPMTVAFNIELRRLRGWPFALCFIAGNIGLLWGLHATLAECVFRDVPFPRP